VKLPREPDLHARRCLGEDSSAIRARRFRLGGSWGQMGRGVDARPAFHEAVHRRWVVQQFAVVTYQPWGEGTGQPPSYGGTIRFRASLALRPVRVYEWCVSREPLVCLTRGGANHSIRRRPAATHLRDGCPRFA
jgi:hypothetical protein